MPSLSFCDPALLHDIWLSGNEKVREYMCDLRRTGRPNGSLNDSH